MIEKLASLTQKINQLWEEWLVFDLVINERTPMNAAECIMWEFNTSPQAVSNCSVLVQSEQIIDACCKAYHQRKTLTRHPRFHLSQWKDPRARKLHAGMSKS